MNKHPVPELSEHPQAAALTGGPVPGVDDLATVELKRGDVLRSWLNAPGNLDFWDALYDRCTWSTPFLSRQFFCAWTACYRDAHEPLLVLGKDTQGAIVAVMPLARLNGSITGAGAHQAEYQGWLSDENVAVRFFKEALTCIAETFPRARLSFKFLAPKLPRQIWEGISQSDPRIVPHENVRPLVRLDDKTISATLTKKSTKSKLNRLKRSGDLTFRRLSDASALERYFDQIIDQYDFRQGAVNDSLPFLQDSRKRQFHLEWMKLAPEQFYVTAMLLDDRVIAAVIGIAGADEVHVAITAHSPFHAQHSPGKLHLYQTALMLAQEGYTWLDLTPGGNWKDRFATEHENVLGLRAWPTVSAARLAVVRERAGHAARRLLHLVGLPPAQLKRGLRMLRKATPRRLVRHVGRQMPTRTELRIYRLSPAEFEFDDQGGPPAAVNALADLCMFEPFYDWQTRQGFLLESMNRLEAGDRSYTICVGGKLVNIGWLVPHQTEAMFSEVNQLFHYPQPGATLYDFCTAPGARRRGHYRRSMCQMLTDLRREGSTSVAYISVLADNIASRRAIENIGFRHFCSVYRIRGLWREKHETTFMALDQSHEKST